MKIFERKIRSRALSFLMNRHNAARAILFGCVRPSKPHPIHERGTTDPRLTLFSRVQSSPAMNEHSQNRPPQGTFLAGRIKV
jgi:hypothetical protein